MSAPDDYAHHLQVTGIIEQDLHEPRFLRSVIWLLRFLGYAVIEPQELDRLHDRLVDAMGSRDGHDRSMLWARVGGGLQAYVERTRGRAQFGEAADIEQSPVMARLVHEAARDVERVLDPERPG